MHATRRLRELSAHQALAYLPVGGIDTGRMDRDPDLAGPRVRIRKIHDLLELRAPELAEAGSFIVCLHPIRGGSASSRGKMPAAIELRDGATGSSGRRHQGFLPNGALDRRRVSAADEDRPVLELHKVREDSGLCPRAVMNLSATAEGVSLT